MCNESEKNTIKLGKIQETMFLPLWGRFIESKKNDPLLYDTKAIEILSQLNYDFSKFEEKLSEYHALSWVIRAKTMDIAVENFIKKHPKATVVNIGAGLDTTFDRVDNGEITWYDLDLPDSIAFREQFISATTRREYISKSVFDYTWFDDVTPIHDNIFFIAAGVLMFFDEKELKQLFSQLATRFPNGEFFFDTLSSQGLKYANDMMCTAGMTDDLLSWGIDSANELTKWDPKIKILDEFSYYERTSRKNTWSNDVITIMNMCDQNKSANFYHLKF